MEDMFCHKAEVVHRPHSEMEIFEMRRGCLQVRLPAHQLNRRIADTHLSRLLDLDPIYNFSVPFLPYLRYKCLTRQYRPRKPDFHILERPISLVHMLRTDSERRQTMQNRHFETSSAGEDRIDVQRIPVAHQSIQCRTFLTRRLFNHSIRLA